MRKVFASLILLCVFPCLASVAVAAQLKVAVASNFYPVLQKLATEFQRDSGHELLISAGSTGKHFAQIQLGAPFDLFLAADAERPAKLLAQGIGLPASNITYAIGRLVLWAPAATSADAARAQLNGDFSYLAMANPRLAPYGRAAREVLEKLELASFSNKRIVMGENIAQTFQFVATGNAQLGFVAASQIAASTLPIGDGVWHVPTAYYAPIEQQALLLKDSDAGQKFMRFLRSPAARQLIVTAGYEVAQ